LGVSQQTKGSILVIGGGIAGIQAALDAANQGFKVYLVEKTPSIGGSMARLDKTFPTNDCSICIEAPKMVEVLRHPNIELLTYHEVQEVSGSVGNFKVTLIKKPRYVIEDKCSGCGKCSEVCPVIVPNEFDLGVGQRKAIYLPFPQAVPMVYTLDPLCQNGTYYKKLGYNACVGTCTIECVVCRSCPIAKCISACHEEGRDAIQLWQRPKKRIIEVGSIIVATGFEIFDPESITEYGYGVYKNVMLTLQYERLLNASGPTNGIILRPTDRKHPRRIAWIQCVGSRDEKKGVPYCCRIGCMYATKQAIITKEHDPSIETYIFYIDLKPYGKRFEDYVKRAKELGVKYVRGRVGRIIEDPNTKDLILRYEDTESGDIGELKVDMVNLTTAILPSMENKELAEKLGIELDEHGFFKVKDLASRVETNIRGIYVAGCCIEPMDIPEAVSTASASVGKAVADIFEARNKEVKMVELPPEKEVSPTDEPRIGVFVCDCGSNIRRVVNVPEVVEYVKALTDVVWAEEGKYLCSADFQDRIKKCIREQNLNRVVVACCTPRTHEPLFRDALREAGLNPYLLEFVNIREHCSWVHMHNPEEATEKAKDLVRMGVAKARLLQPEVEFELPVGKDCLVIGGGIAGMNAAVALAEMGFKVLLVEKTEELGGLLRKMQSLFPYDKPAEEIIDQLIQKIKRNKNIITYTGAKIKGIEGYIGNYKVLISNSNGLDEEFKVSTIIVATGIKEIEPNGQYGYGNDRRIITQLQLEDLLKNGKLPNLRNIVIINCVGSREGGTPCCRIGCGVSIKNAKRIKELYPEAEVYILYKDLMIFNSDEIAYYKDVIEKFGITLIRYTEFNKPKVQINDKHLKVNVYDSMLRKEIELVPDLLVLTVALEGSEEAEEIRKLLRVPVGTAGFYEEAHVKLRPLEFAAEGIYLCGGAHSPQTVKEALTQAIGAACKASIPMSRGYVKSEGITAYIDPSKCVKCGICAKTCPYNAIALENDVYKVIPALCKSCGTCSAECAKEAITMRHFTDEQIFAQIEEALRYKPEEKILAFACNWCSYGAADTAGISRFEYPSNIRIIRVMCSGRVASKFVVRAFEKGAGMVLVAGCEFPTCHYAIGNYKCEKRMDILRKRLTNMGINPSRLRTVWLSAAHGKKFAEIVREMVEELKSMNL